MFAVYALQGMQGSPPWWWVAVGAAGVTAFSAAGFAVGAFFPSRFAAPVAAFGAFLALFASDNIAQGNTSGWPLILPTNAKGNYQLVSGIFYRYLPDLPIARVMFLAGIAVAALSVLGLPARAGGAWLRRAAAVVTLAGVAAAGTAVGLARTAQLTPPWPCHPRAARRGQRPTNRLHPGLRPPRRGAGVPESGLPPLPAGGRSRPAAGARGAGRPARHAGQRRPGGRPVHQRNVRARGWRGGDDQRHPAGAAPAARRVQLAAQRHPRVRGAVRSGTAAAIGARVRRRGQRRRHRCAAGSAGGHAAARRPAVRRAAPGADHPRAAELGAGRPAGARWRVRVRVPGAVPAGPVYAAARRLAALPTAARHAWLAAHLAALRSGQLTLGQLP